MSYWFVRAGGLVAFVLWGVLFPAAGWLRAQVAPLSLTENDGFCAGGAPRPAPVQTFGSLCGHGDATVGRAVTSSFRITGPVEIFLCGDFNDKGIHLQLEDVTRHQSLDIRPVVWPSAIWQRFRFRVSDAWKNDDLRLVATDGSTGPVGWLAFSAPIPVRNSRLFRDAQHILLSSILFSALVFLPGFTLAALAIRLGVRGVLKSGFILLLGIALPGYLVFFAYVAPPRAGALLSPLLTLLCASGLAILLLRSKPRERVLLRQLLVPTGATLCYALCILSLGFLFGGLTTSEATAASRFAARLPTDNTIPFIFATDIARGPAPKPMVSNWLSSDRPPLQTGIVLSIRRWGSELSYQIISVILQSLWVFAVWLLLRALRIRAASMALVLITIGLSGFALLNTFYVWPKLLSAAFLIAGAIPALMAKRRNARGQSWLIRCLMAAAIAFSLLSHGGSMFALLGLLLLVVLRQREALAMIGKEIAIVGALTLLFYAPWMGYQHFVDPPGDRLLKWHLAGVEQPTPTPAFETIYQSYSRLTWDTWLKSKEKNLDAIFGREFEYLAQYKTFLNPLSRRWIRVMQFYFPTPALGLMTIGLASFLFRRKVRTRLKEFQAAERLLGLALLSAAPWALLMFEPGSSVVHQGAYAMIIAAMAALLLALHAASPVAAWFVCAVQSALQWLVYAPDLAHIDFPNSLPVATNYWMLMLHFAALTAFVVLLVQRGGSARGVLFRLRIMGRQGRASKFPDAEKTASVTALGS